MFKSFKVGSVFGIPIKLDITLLVILPLFAWLIGSQLTELVEVLNVTLGTSIESGPLVVGAWPWVLGAIAVVGLFIGVTLHELGHSLVAIYYGYDIDSITLWLLGGVAQFTEQPRKWHHEFWIAIAGPIVSVGVGLICYLAVVVLPARFDAALFIFGYLAVLNVVLALFNMLPAFPLDGGRVLRSLFARNQPFPQATVRAVRIGKFFAVLLGLFGLLVFNVFMIAIAFFIYLVGAAEGRQTAITAVFEGVPVRRVMTPAEDVVVVPADLPLSELLDRMMDHRHSGYPVDRDGRIVGIVTLEDLRTIPPERRAERTVSDVMSTDLKTVEAESDLLEALTGIARNNVGRLIVTDADGEFTGILTRTDIVRAFEIIREHQQTSEAQSTPVLSAMGGNPPNP